MPAPYDDPSYGQISDRQLDALLPDDEPDPDPRDFAALDPTCHDHNGAA